MIVKNEYCFSENLNSKQIENYKILLEKCGLDKLDKSIKFRENNNIGEDLN